MDLQTRVLILCSNRLLRESVVRILNKRREFQAVPQTLGSSPREEVGDSKADVAVCDSLPLILEAGSGGAKFPIPLLLVAMDDNPDNFLTAVRHGVLGYVLQEASAAEVISAIRAVAAGEAVCPAKLAKLLFDCVAAQTGTPAISVNGECSRLTRRELQLVPMIRRGLTNKEIANQLNISEQTVKSHVHRILQKLGAENRQGLSQIYSSEGMQPRILSPS